MISRRAADRLRAGHVWVYRSDIEHLVEVGPGLLPVADYRGFPLGTALWSPMSQIALRMVSPDPALTPAGWLALFEERLRQAIRLRTAMVEDGTDACRLVFSEADQLPGLIVDRYGELVLFEILAKAP
jgi:23S rRNA (cytosine1962-C5)-methyltransferase